MPTTRLERAKKRLELLFFASTVMEKSTPYLYIYTMAAMEMIKIKGYCTVDQLSYLFNHDFRSAYAYVSYGLREGMLLRENNMVSVTDKGKKEINNLISGTAEIQRKFIEKKHKAKRIDKSNEKKK